MSNFTDFISGGGGSASFPTIFLHNSQTWVPPQDGNIMIHVIGAGGSGCMSTTSTTYQSGAAGGYCRKNSLAVTTAGSFTVTVGAGGASVVGAVGAGSAGGTTSVSGTGLGSTLTATGGAGGAVSSGATTAGGTASNGDVNNTGGTGGYQKGGGAVGLTGTGNSGVYRNFLADGGSCDIIGDFYSSTLGQISGGVGQSGTFVTGTNWPFYNKTADPLAGGCFVYGAYFVKAPDASIGGGGGAHFNSYNTSYQRSGRGGEGCVVIQYIP